MLSNAIPGKGQTTPSHVNSALVRMQASLDTGGCWCGHLSLSLQNSLREACYEFSAADCEDVRAEPGPLPVAADGGPDAPLGDPGADPDHTDGVLVLVTVSCAPVWEVQSDDGASGLLMVFS